MTPPPSPPPPPSNVTWRALIDRYDALLLDAFGVLTLPGGAIPGAPELLRTLRAEEKPFFVVTNTSAALPEHNAEVWQGYGLAIEPDQIIAAGSLLGPWYERHGLVGADTVVLGTPDTHLYAERAGAQVVALTEQSEPAVMVIGDDVAEPALRTLGAAVTVILRARAAGRPLKVVLPNPDVIYPRGGDRFGVTAGALAVLIEAAVARRHPEAPLEVDRLGKPYAPIFEAALARCPSPHVVMVGDQLDTDVAGANRCGIDSVLVPTGVSRLPERRVEGAPWPTYLLAP